MHGAPFDCANRLAHLASLDCHQQLIRVRWSAGGRGRYGTQACRDASDAGEMITELALAVQLGLAIEDLTSVFHPYLTLSEGVKLAAQTFDKDVAMLSCCAG